MIICIYSRTTLAVEIVNFKICKSAMDKINPRHSYISIINFFATPKSMKISNFLFLFTQSSEGRSNDYKLTIISSRADPIICVIFIADQRIAQQSLEIGIDRYECPAGLSIFSLSHSPPCTPGNSLILPDAPDSCSFVHSFV